MPEISVITVVRNGRKQFEQCLHSVLSQSGVDLEYIVIDGESTDGTLDVIRQHADRIAYWSSAPDSGIAQAMNRGWQQATGRWLLFLHADDYLLHPRALEAALAQVPTACRLAAFPIDYGSGEQVVRRHPGGFGFKLNLKTTFLHQATLIQRSVFEECGGYDESLQVEMDYEHFLRLYRRGIPACVVPAMPFSFMRDTGISARKDPASLRARLAEERQIQFRHAPSAVWRWMYRVYWALYPRYKMWRHR